MNKHGNFKLESDSLRTLSEALEQLGAGFAELPTSTSTTVDIAPVLQRTAERLHDNYPYFHPLYAGQMLKPPHPVAKAAYALAMWINPNNHALDGGRASSQMEKEAVAEIAAMFGLAEHLGHLCGGGTMANLEALWIAAQEHPGSTILASEQAHYTHERISKVLGFRFESVACDRYGRMDVSALQARLDDGGIGTLVATIGTTAVGSVDPLPELLDLARTYNVRVHADAAYGGYFGLCSSLDKPARAAFDRLSEVDSIVIDPHKHGLQPYGCGCVLFKDPKVGRHYQHDSPYTYFSSDELHLGEISLECSRPGAAAVALWATQQLLPLEPGGDFAGQLDRSRAAASALYEKLRIDERFVVACPPELDIVFWAPRAATATEASALSRAIFAEAAKDDLHLALAELPTHLFALEDGAMRADQETMTCLRSVLMKPEHLDWVEEIYARLVAAHARASNKG